MLHLTSGPALVVEAGLAIFCLIDAIISPEAAVRWVPRWGWALFLLVFPLCGSILWLVAGHPWRLRTRTAPTAAVPAPATSAAHAVPEASPDVTLAAELLAVHDEHEQTLRAWEADLRRREAALAAALGRPPTG